MTASLVQAPPVPTDEQLAALTTQQRHQLAERLAALSEPRPVPYPRRRLAIVALMACLGLAAWMVTMAATLPAHYVAGHWDTAWVGFDAILLVSLAATGWTAWRASPLAPAAAVTTAALLVCDAWFDLTTANTGPDLLTSASSAVLLELPLAALAALFAYRQLRRSRP